MMISNSTDYKAVLGPSGQPIDPATIEAARQTQDDRFIRTSRVPYRPRTNAGTIITPDRALTISAVWACIRYLTQSVAKLPWRVKRQDGTNNTIQDRHWLDPVLNKRPCDEYSSFQFRETLLSWALRHGNGYAEIERAMDGRAIALWPLHPTRVTVKRELDTGRLFYEVTNSLGGTVDMDPEDIFHLRGFGEGPVGLSVMAYAAQSLGWVKAAQLFGAGFFGNGAQLAGVVQMKKALSPEALAELRAEFNSLYGGAAKGNNTAFLDNEMEYKPIGIEPDKGQFIETNQHLVDEVCRWFGVPPHKVYHLLRATFSNIEHQSIEVVEDSLRPWAVRFQDEADFKLFGANRSNLFTQIEFKRLLRPDTKTRMEWAQGMRNIGAVSVDEIRDDEDLNEIGTAKGGKKYTMQSGFTTLDKIGEDPPPAPAPPPPAPGTEPAAPGEEGEEGENGEPLTEGATAVLYQFINEGIIPLETAQNAN